MLRMIVVSALVLAGIGGSFGAVAVWSLNLPIKQVADGKCVRVLVIEDGKEVAKRCSWLAPGAQYHLEHVGR